MAVTPPLAFVSVEGQLTDSVVLDVGCQNNHYVEDLVGLEPDVKFPWEQPLGEANGIDVGAKDVCGTHENEPFDAKLVVSEPEPLVYRCVGGWNHTYESNYDKDARSKPSEVGSDEPWVETEEDPQRAEDRDCREVENCDQWSAVKGVVDPGDKGTHHQEPDPTVVEGSEFDGGLFAVWGDCVEKKGRAHADDGAEKEGTECHLFCKVNFGRTSTQVPHPEEEKQHRAKEMRPDVDRFGMYLEEREEAES